MPRARKEKPRSRGLAKSRINHSPPLKWGLVVKVGAVHYCALSYIIIVHYHTLYIIIIHYYLIIVHYHYRALSYIIVRYTVHCTQTQSHIISYSPRETLSFFLFIRKFERLGPGPLAKENSSSPCQYLTHSVALYL